MIGALIGDCIGSVYERKNIDKSLKHFKYFTKKSHFTDDTILTIATAETLLNNKNISNKEFSDSIKKWGLKYPDIGYGKMFKNWLNNSISYSSFGNGGAMRISPIPFFYNNLIKVESNTFLNVIETHNHFYGMKYALILANSIYKLLYNSKEDLLIYINTLDITLPKYNDLLLNYKFSAEAKNTIPEAISCFIESNSFKDCINKSIKIGGDSDTLCSMTCALAEAYYKSIPKDLIIKTLDLLDKEMIIIIKQFYNNFIKKNKININKEFKYINYIINY